MTTWELIGKTTIFFRRTNLAVLLGVAVASAILTGALLVGDSVRGSLRRLALDRLGHYEAVLTGDTFFRQALAEDLVRAVGQAHGTWHIEPVIFVAGSTVEFTGKSSVRRATQVFTIAVRPSFWHHDDHAWSVPPLEDGQVVLNQRLADELGVQVGDRITLRLPAASQVPADSTLAQKTGRIRSIPGLTVASIVANQGVANFSLQRQQTMSRNLFINLHTLQEELRVPGEINGVLIARHPPEDRPAVLASRAQQYTALLRPSLIDFGLRLQRVTRTFVPTDGPAQVVYDYWQLTSRRMLIPPEVVAALGEVMERRQGQVIMTYLADSMRPAQPKADGATEIPYSLVTGIDSTSAFPLLPSGEKLGDDEIILNSWAADRLQVGVGESLILEYFEPETIHGSPRLRSHRFAIRAIVPIREPASPFRRNRPAQFSIPPTVFNDPDLTPTVEGITDQETIENWEAPFPFDIRRVQRADDQYWQNHRTTPKAFVSLRTAQRLWGSRFGDATAIRFPAAASDTEESLVRDMTDALFRHRVPEKLGFVFQPIRQESLLASRGTTPFDVLFLALSSFLMIAAVLLVVLLFRLGMELRTPQLGLLVALGWTRRRARFIWLMEGLLVTALGAAIGLLGAVAYCRWMIAGLNSPHWWLGAVSSPFLRLFVTGKSLVIGYVSCLGVCGLTIAWATRGLSRLAPRRLLAGQVSTMDIVCRHASRVRWWIAALLLAAMVLSGSAVCWEGEVRGGMFVGAGWLFLMGLLLAQWQWLRGGWSFPQLTLLRFAATTAARHPTRSVLTMGLMACATFLIISLSAFRVDPSLRGAGGFRLVGESSTPIYELLAVDGENRGTPSAHPSVPKAPSVPRPQTDAAPVVHAFALRLKPGEDASCRNLYQVTRPRVLGVPRAFADRYDSTEVTAFSFASVDRHVSSTVGTENPWHLLWTPSDDAVPVILDANTAAYSLHWTGGVGSLHTVEFDLGRRVTFRIVGLLSNSLLQGQLLISEEQFRRFFPEISGYQYFLIDVPPDELESWRSYWEERYSDQGLALRETVRVLGELLAVQNTYLSTFQTLGALGLLLGSVGVAVVQMRSVVERRGELALLRAIGFRRLRLAVLVLAENFSLLLAGLAVGTLAALAAVLPHVALGGAAAPWYSLVSLLAGIVVVGLASSMAAVRFTLQAPLLSALRGE